MTAAAFLAPLFFTSRHSRAEHRRRQLHRWAREMAARPSVLATEPAEKPRIAA